MNEQCRGEWTSASNALPDRLCPGRYQAQIGLPELPPTEESESGRVIHALWTGTKPPRKPMGEEIEKAEALREQEQMVAKEFFGRGEDLVRIVERRLWHELPALNGDSPGGTLKTSGQFDVVLVQPESARALIFDGKSGWLPVSPTSCNLQLRRLAALLWLQLESQEIGVSIVKPFAKPQPTCLYTVSDLERSVWEMEEDVRQSHLPDAARAAGEEQCRYCRARESCATRLAWLSGALPSSWPQLPMVSARDWSPAQCALFLEREKDARDWLDARKEEIKTILGEKPDAAPGFGLRPGRSLETITDAQQVFTRFAQRFGGSAERFLNCVRVGKTALTEEVRTLSGHKGKALEADLESLLAGCVDFKTSSPVIERLR